MTNPLSPLPSIKVDPKLYAKFLTAVAGLIAIAITLVSDGAISAQDVIAIGIAAASAFGVRQVKNG